MKRIRLYITIGVVLLMAACESHYDETIALSQLTIALVSPDTPGKSFAHARVELRGIGRDVIFVDTTDEQSLAHFQIPPGIYEASSSKAIKYGANSIEINNGTSGQIIVEGEAPTTITLNMVGSRLSQLVIKELYNGGIMKDDGKAFQSDKSFIIYNNTGLTASFNNLCVGISAPYNSQASNKWYDKQGKLIYEAEGYIPAIDGIWYFPEPLTIEAYSQIVVNCHGAIDNTQTYPNSVNYAHADYYCMYNPETGYANQSYYPTPASVIPSSHYLKAVKIGVSNAWPLSTTSPAFFLFQTQGTTPQEFGTNVRNMTYVPGSAQTDINKVLKVPVEWIVDGIEVFAASAKNANQKRLTPAVDAGFVDLTNQHGHSLYRNVDKEETENLKENQGKLVYNYSLGVSPSTDPSGIDAEASIRNGAHIVYQDTNNSSADFHEREKCSLRE